MIKKQLENTGYFYFKDHERFFNALFQNLFICKQKSVMKFLAITDGTHGTLQSVRWPCESIILSIGNFQSRTEVQLNSW